MRNNGSEKRKIRGESPLRYRPSRRKTHHPPPPPRSPFFNAELARKAPLPRDAGPRLATFISNCGGGARNRLITDLVKEGIVFDHFGKCKEDIFGGVKQVGYVSSARVVTR